MQRGIDQFSQRVFAAGSVGEHQTTERRESRTQAVVAGTPLLAGVQGLGPPVVLADREYGEVLVATECEANLVRRVDRAPTIIEYRAPMSGITQRDRRVGQRRVLG